METPSNGLRDAVVRIRPLRLRERSEMQDLGSIPAQCHMYLDVWYTETPLHGRARIVPGTRKNPCCVSFRGQPPPKTTINVLSPTCMLRRDPNICVRSTSTRCKYIVAAEEVFIAVTIASSPSLILRPALRCRFLMLGAEFYGLLRYPDGRHASDRAGRPEGEYTPL